MLRLATSAAAPSGVSLNRRALAFALSAAIHAAVLAALLLWRFAPTAEIPRTDLTVVDLPEDRPEDPPKPPPPPPSPDPKRGSPMRGEQGAPGKKAEAAPLASAIIPVIPPRFPPAEVPATGTEANSGAGLVGLGSGAGGVGNGSGGGGNGSGGSGGRGEGTYPEIIRGEMRRRADYPKALRGSGTSGVAVAVVRIGTKGEKLSCRISQSSGNGLLDAQMCKIIMDRYRFRPARDASGKAVEGSFEIETAWEDLDWEKQ